MKPAAPTQIRNNKAAVLHALYRSPTGFYSQMARTYLSTVRWLKGYTFETHLRISRRKTQPAIRLRAARERRLARLYKRAALESIYNGHSHYSWEMKKVAGDYRKFYKGPYAHPDR